MAVAYSDTVLNYSGLLKTKTNNNTGLLDAVFSRGKSMGDGIVSTGIRKINSIEFALSSGYSIANGSQPAITEQGSVTAIAGSPVLRDQQTNVIQLFQEAVSVTYLKQSAIGNLAGLNIAGQYSNVTNELDFQVAVKMAKMKKDLDYTLINGVYVKSSNSGVAYKSRGLITGITTNAATYTKNTTISATTINSAITAALSNGFSFEDGRIELWVNPAELANINAAYKGETGFGLPRSRTEGGISITSILTNYGFVDVHYDVIIPAKTYLLLNMSSLAITELDTVVDGVNKGSWFYEKLAQNGAAENGQLYAQAGIDYGAEWNHIKITEAGEETLQTVNFNLKDNAGTPAVVEGATIVVEKIGSTNETTLTTDASGNATSNLSTGDYTYLVSKTGYILQTGSFTIASATVTVNITAFTPNT